MKQHYVALLAGVLVAFSATESLAARKPEPVPPPAFSAPVDVINCSSASTAAALKMVSDDRIEIGGYPIPAGPGGQLERIVVRTTEADGSVEAVLFRGCTSCGGGSQPYTSRFSGFTPLSSDIRPKKNEQSLRLAWNFGESFTPVRGYYETISRNEKSTAKVTINVIRLRNGRHVTLAFADPSNEERYQVISETSGASGELFVERKSLAGIDSRMLFLINTGTETLRFSSAFDAMFLFPFLSGKGAPAGSVGAKPLDATFLSPGMAASLSSQRKDLTEKGELAIALSSGEFLKVKVK